MGYKTIYILINKSKKMKDTILKIINEIRETNGHPVLENIFPDDKLREDLNLTSFDLAELTVRIEDESGIDIFEDGLVSTVGEIFQRLGI